ncbi:MAG: F0F1 ATP synthase subunit B [Gammaproteobacteria bacterium]
MNINMTLLGQMITFSLFVWFTLRFVWPPIIKALQERQQQIADGLAAAEQGQQELELSQQKAASLLNEAKEQSALIVQQAEKRSLQVLADAKERARAEGERLIAAAQSELEQMQNNARESLRKEVAALALASAEKVLGRVIDTTVNDSLVAQTITELEKQ